MILPCSQEALDLLNKRSALSNIFVSTLGRLPVNATGGLGGAFSATGMDAH
jgi:hypothetical protein